MTGRTASPWVRWAVLAGLGFLAVVAVILLGEASPALLFGWAVGMAIAAGLILFRRS